MGHPDPVALTIGNIEIRWYGLLITIAMILGILIAMKRSSKYNMTIDDVIDAALCIIPCAIIGARAYYVLFNLQYYHSIKEAINIRHGGLAVHGGIILCIIALTILCKFKKKNPFDMFDMFAPCLALGQSIGRWGNYFNSEAHGGPTDLPWGIMVDGMKVHPTFLYESIWCFLLFIFLIIWSNKKRTASGQVICLYGILYSIERIFVESLRTDSLMIGPFKQAQVLSATIIIVCVVLFIVCTKRYPLKKNEVK